MLNRHNVHFFKQDNDFDLNFFFWKMAVILFRAQSVE